MAQEIVAIQQMGDALRNTGYKSIDSAVAEILDNSIEAGATDIFLIVSEKTNAITGRKCVTEFAFLDNGNGMNNDLLSSCLGIGISTRTARNGMGRFGVGLPQASLHVCPTVDVYSWQNDYENCHKVFLDILKVKDGTQQVIEDPCQCSIPDKFNKFLEYNTPQKKYNFKTNGTLVQWKNCDRVTPKMVYFLFKTLQFTLGQKFRYLIKDGTHNIKLIHLENEDNSIDIMPNDPMLLMNPNYVLGNPDDPKNIEPFSNTNCTEPLFEPYATEQYPNGEIVCPVQYISQSTGEILTSNVTIKFSKVRNIFYDKTAISGNPGGTKMGKHVAEMEGISIVRAGREIDFGKFDFYDNLNEPQHRWWGCEINFNPELDEAFGVANNKQHVELRKVKPEDTMDEEVQPMWLQLYDVVHNTIDKMYSENETTRENARTVVDVTPPASTIINIAEEGNTTPNEADNIKNTTPKDVLIAKNIEILKEQGIENPSVEDATVYMQNLANIIYKDLGRGPFFDYSFSYGNALVTINTSHVFYTNFISQVINNIDAKTAFELFIASLVMTIRETNLRQSEANDLLVQEWNNKLRKYITEQNNFGG